MAQVYYPVTGAPKSVENEIPAEKHLKAEDVQEAYIAQKDKLVEAIDCTKTILGDLRGFNKDSWVVRYPQFNEKAEEHETTRRRGGMRRSLSFADDPASETEVVFSSKKGELKRATTLPPIADEQLENVDEAQDGPESDFNVLRLDLKLGPHGSSSSAASLVSQLEKSSIANLLDERIGSSINHIDKLRLRIEDTSSKVLVTGDLNSGKSTFVNALLRKEIMPVDQQPCTTAFCEVHDAAENEGKEEVHIVKDGATYSVKNESSFTRASLADIEDIVAENENSQQILKVYLTDSRPPVESLLNNGVVDISLIDAPGLNRDSLKTTALFARQEEIDVVVFVVSAENHFTLSSKEFLWNASNEKAYLFIVVNKYDQIKNKEKCRKLVLEQIKQLSPRTYDDAEDLVHFVDSATALSSEQPSFDALEASLRSFVLVKRSKSKLAPVSTYLSNLLADIALLAGSNAIVAESEMERAVADLDRSRPVLEKMKAGREALEESLETVEEESVGQANAKTKWLLTEALERVGEGRLGVDKPMVTMPSYPGLLGIWDYAKAVRQALLTSLDVAVKLAEDEARVVTTSGVHKISQIGDEHLPEGVERSRRVFVPEAMFSARRAKKGGRASSVVVVAGGTHGLGIGLAQRPELLETSFFDLFDAQHQFWVHFGDKKGESGDDEEISPTALSVVSVGLGALTVVGGKTLGMRSVIEGVVRISEAFSNETTRRWAAPVIGAFTIGLTAYFIMELPSSIPRTIGRRIRSNLVKNGEGREEELFVNAHSTRVSRETRKVLRLASWDLRERFRSAMDERGKEVKDAEEMEKRAKKALEYFLEINQRTGDVRGNVVSATAL